MGCLVHGSVVTVVGQNSMPISTAIRSLRQNSSFWFRRRAVASNLPSSKDPFRLAIVPPKNRVGDAVTRQSSPALSEERVSYLEMFVFPRLAAPSSKVGIFGTAGASLGYFKTKRIVTVALPTHERLRCPLCPKVDSTCRSWQIPTTPILRRTAFPPSGCSPDSTRPTPISVSY
jgi:hypothetical protein